MHYLVIVSIIWAFSFGLIGQALSEVDPVFAATIRLGIAGLVFIPFLRLSKIPQGSHIKLIGCGAIQFGIMYVCYMMAFQIAQGQSHLVALFSILTPLYVVLINDLLKREFHSKYLYAALLAVAGAAIIKAKAGSMNSLWIAFGLMQIAGIAFGFGQVYYRDWKRKHVDVKDHQIFALLYAGGFGVAAIACIFFTDWVRTQLDTKQLQVLAYLGIVASGAGFFLWNKGAALCRAGTLAAFNNAVVPLAIACSLFIFGEWSELEGGAFFRLIVGSAFIIAAVAISEKPTKQS
ncbi:MAG: EamA family transporter [Verrucomicrobiota bacterium]|nr:EamA family transporter [Verrucomicrobiota bacterium]MEC8614824.1 EamA family transporter [Verrucomicrobiota bacterium]